MYARVVTAQFQPGKVDEGVSRFRDAVAPRAKEYSGFKGALLLTDPDAGKMLAFTLWETEAELEATESGFREAAAQLAPTLAGPPTQERYEIRVQV